MTTKSPAAKAAKPAAASAASTSSTTAEDKLKPATEIAASGATIEPTIVERVDMSHPAVDDEPRAGTTADMNRIDFNDPSVSGQEAVERNLDAQAASGE